MFSECSTALRVSPRHSHAGALQVRPDWSSSKLKVMYNALERKFSVYPGLADLLLSTGSAELSGGLASGRVLGQRARRAG